MRGETPYVTVVILNYDGLEHLEPCFRSLSALEYPSDRLDLILVDNGSTDGSVGYMEERFPEVQVVRNEHNLGFAAGNNVGARVAQGDIVAFANNDMHMDRHWLSSLVAPFSRGEDVAAVGGKVLSWSGKRIDFAEAGVNFCGYGYQLGKGERTERRPSTTELNEEGGVRPSLFVCGGNMAVRRELFLQVGGFDEDFFAYYEDIDLGWRLWLMGYRVLFAPGAVVYHRHHGTSSRMGAEKRRLLYERNALYTIVKNYEEENLQRVLPVALLLLMERCYLLSGLDSAHFRLPGETGPPSLDRVDDRYTVGYYLRQAWRALWEGGPAELWNKVKGELHWRSAHPAFRGLMKRRRARRAGEDFNVPPQALSGLVAADDLIRHLPRLWEKRQAVQQARQRSDAEVFRLFKRPLELSMFDPDYQAAQRLLTRLWGIGELFGAGDDASSSL